MNFLNLKMILLEYLLEHLTKFWNHSNYFVFLITQD